MAGKIKLDGTQFLEKVNNEFKITNSELKLKSTGNTIVDSSGNAVVSESGGNVTLGNVRLPSSGGIKDSSGNNILTESGGNITISNSAIKLKSSGNSITKSDGTTAVLSESGGVVTLNNGTIGSGVVFPTLPADKGASLQLILTQSFSSVSSVAFEDVFSSSFRNYKLVGEVSGLSGDLRFRFFTSGTTEFTTSVYSFAGIGSDDGNTQRQNNGNDQSYWELDHITADQVCFDYTIYKAFLASDTFFSGTNLTERTVGSEYVLMAQGGNVDSGTSFSGCNIYPSAGTVSGNISIYGIKE